MIPPPLIHLPTRTAFLPLSRLALMAMPPSRPWQREQVELTEVFHWVTNCLPAAPVRVSRFLWVTLPSQVERPAGENNLHVSLVEVELSCGSGVSVSTPTAQALPGSPRYSFCILSSDSLRATPFWWRASARFVLSQGPCTVGVCGLLFLLWVTNGLRCLLLHRGLIVIVVPVLLASACTVEAAVTTPPSPIGTSVCVAEAFGGAEPPPCPAGAVGGMHLRPVPTPVRAGCPLPTVIEEHAVSSRPVQCIALRAAIPLTSWDPDPVDTVDPRAWESQELSAVASLQGQPLSFGGTNCPFSANQLFELLCPQVEFVTFQELCRLLPRKDVDFLTSLHPGIADTRPGQLHCFTDGPFTPEA